MEWRELNGRGAIWSWVGVAHPAHPALREFGPYVVALIELDDLPQIKLMAQSSTPTPPPCKSATPSRSSSSAPPTISAQPRWRLA